VGHCKFTHVITLVFGPIARCGPSDRGLPAVVVVVIVVVRRLFCAWLPLSPHVLTGWSGRAPSSPTNELQAATACRWRRAEANVHSPFPTLMLRVCRVFATFAFTFLRRRMVLSMLEASLPPPPPVLLCRWYCYCGWVSPLQMYITQLP
jgi:hypothetical protein